MSNTLARRDADGSLHRAVWRWHFYAGLLTLPVLVLLAVTGAIYLYKPELERLLYREWIALPAPVAEPLPAAAMIERVERYTSGTLLRLERPADTATSWRATLDTPLGERLAFVHPGDGRVLGRVADGGAVEWVKSLHSLAIAGPVGNALVEIVAGWTIVLVLSGFYLWWPRRGASALSLRGSPRARPFWRDLHASGGALVGLVVLFLAVTGMPWSVFWGERLHDAIASSGAGRPAPPAGDEHAHHAATAAALPWTLRDAPAPHGGHGGADATAVLATAAARGLRPPYALIPPRAAGEPWIVSRTAVRAEEARVLWVDAGSGRALQDSASRDFGAGARAVEWGIHTHQGEQYGEANRLLMLAGCLGTLLLAGTAPALWWKRRRGGRLSAPPRAEDARRARGVAAIMGLLGLLYPLTGLTMAAAWGVDRLLVRFRGSAG